MTSDADRIEEPADGPARAALVWMHGLGATAEDFYDLGRHLQCPGLRIIALQAPVRPVGMYDGQTVPAWFDMVIRPDGTITSDLDGLNETAARIRGVLQEQRNAGIEALAVGGYSQGGAMALYTALTHPEPLAGAVCLSGYLPQFELLLTTAASAPRIPLFIGHGAQDEVVPYAYSEFSRDRLESLDYPVRWYGADFGHQVTAEELQELSTFVRGIFAG